MMIKKQNNIACFFSTASKDQLLMEQYSIQDINILNEMNFEVKISNSFNDIPFFSRIYFSWWASGSILPLIKAKLSFRPIIVVAGGNEAVLYKDSITGQTHGYLDSPWYKKLATRLTLKFSDKILVVSRYMLNNVIKLGAKDPVVVYNSVNTEEFNLADFPREYITSIFSMDGNAFLLKRVENYLYAIKKVVEIKPGLKFLIIGKKGDAFERVIKIVKELDIESHVIFLGKINNSDVVKWLQRSICYVQVSDTETFGLSIAEAMSCGTPVIVSKVGGIPEVVGETGYYVDHNSVKSISNGIINLLDLSEYDYLELSKESRKRILRNFTYEMRKQKIQSLVKELIDK